MTTAHFLPALLLGGESLRPPLTGIGHYTRALAQALAATGAIGRLAIFDGRRVLPLSLALAPAATGIAAAGLRRCLRSLPGLYAMRQRLLERNFERLAREATLYHEPNFILKPFAGPCVTTIHDLSCLVHPEFHPRERVRFFERHLPRSLVRASHIITVSRFSRDELVSRLGIAAHRITVTPLAASPRFRPMDEATATIVLKARGLSWQGYVLSAATFEPRKNLGGLIAAYARLPAALKRHYPLVLAGARGWHERQFAAAVERLVARGELIRLGYVSDDELPALMSGCRCFAYPSFYEGFGLPVLEAQACGAVTLAANRASLPEVAGPDCLLADPDDSDALSEALRRALEDGSLARRARASGPAFAATFTWQKTAQQTLAAYAAALAA